MKNSFMYVSPVLNLIKPEHQLIVAEQEKALYKEEFEMARHRLMGATAMVNKLKASIYYSGKDVCNGILEEVKSPNTLYKNFKPS